MGALQLVTVAGSGLAGLAAGSFLNVVAYRVPRKLSVVRPPSSCPSCLAPLGVVDLVPVLSWVWLRGRCRHCGAAVSWRYPAVELAAAILCIAAAGALGPVAALPSVAALLLCALVTSLLHDEGCAVPVAVPVIGALAAVSLQPLALAQGDADRIGWAALGAAITTLGAVIARLAGRHRRGIAQPSLLVVLAALGTAAGWLWPPGGVVVGGGIAVVGVSVSCVSSRVAPLVALVAASAALLASAAIGRA